MDRHGLTTLNRDAPMSEKSYPRDPADCTRQSSSQLRSARELAGRLRLRGDETVLVIGAGDGRLASSIARLLPRGQVVAIDAAAARVARARAAFPNRKRPNLRFLMMDPARIVFESQFDLVVSDGAGSGESAPPASLPGAARALKPGGRLFFRMDGEGHLADLLAAAGEIARRRPGAGLRSPSPFPSADECRGWLAAAGLQPARVDPIPRTKRWRDTRSFASWLRTAGRRYLELAEEDRRGSFSSALSRLYLRDHPPTPSGLVRAKTVRLDAEALKPETSPIPFDSAPSRPENAAGGPEGRI